MNLATNTEDRPRALERPEMKQEKVVRAATRFFRIASEEGLTPFEMAVAWQRIGRTILREAVWKVATGSLIRTLALEVAAEMPEDPSRLASVDGKGGER